MKRHPTDSQRQKVYDAELHNDWSPKATQRLTATEAQALADRMVEWLNSNGMHTYGGVTVKMVNGSGARAFETNVIHLGRNRPLRWILCHEMAHIVHPSLVTGFTDRGKRDLRPHGAAFCAIYLRLVARWCSAADRDSLKASFRSGGVRYTPPRAGRTMTAAEREAAAARLAAHRRPKSPVKYVYRSTNQETGEHVFVSPRRSDQQYITSKRGNETWWSHISYRTADQGRALSRTTPESLRSATPTLWTPDGWDPFEIVAIPNT